MRLKLEAAQSSGVGSEVFGKELQGNVAVQLEVFGLIHHTHPATAEFFDDAVVRDGGVEHVPDRIGVDD